jgi:PcfJ-like protein
MGKKIRFKEARRRQAENVVCAVLQAHAKRKTAPVVATHCDDFKPQYRDKLHAYRAFALCRPQDWHCRLKSRSEERRFIDLVRFTFARFPVPAHLERLWIEGVEDDFVDDVRARALRAGERSRTPDLIRWYIVAAQGGSLHKQASHPYMSRLETHHFLNAPSDLITGQAAFWYAIARAQTDHAPVARKIAQTRLRDFSVASTFWKEIARFFVRNETTIAEMNDLIDFIALARAEDETFSLKGRTLLALRRRMEQWHRALAKQHAICGGAWIGRAIPDAAYAAGKDDKKAVWRFRQIKTGNDLFREGPRMHHCVGSYKALCMSGEVSIWSLTCEFPIGHFNKGVTIEVRRSGLIVQCRGYANRSPYGNEVTMVKRWAVEYGLTWAAWAG